MAVASAVAYSTETARLLGVDWVTISVATLVVPPAPSSTVASSMDSDGGASSSTMVPVAVAVPIRAPVEFEMVRVKDSSSSSNGSPITTTGIESTTWPGSRVNDPLRAV